MEAVETTLFAAAVLFLPPGAYQGETTTATGSFEDTAFFLVAKQECMHAHTEMSFWGMRPEENVKRGKMDLLPCLASRAQGNIVI